MFIHSPPLRALWLAICLAWFPCSAVLADADSREVGAYRLTDAGLQKYLQAVRNLSELGAHAPGTCDDEGADDGDDVTSIDAAVARIVATPGASKALQSAGMAPREFVVFSMSVLQAGLASWALEQPGGTLPPDVRMENVNFFRKNQAAMDKARQESTPGRCEDESADEADAEPGTEE